MREDNHYVGHAEDVMAYYDSELSPNRAQLVATHLQDCQECRHIVEDLRNVSEEMSVWQLDSAEVEMSSELAAALQQQITAQAQPQAWWSRWFKWREGRRLGFSLVYGSVIVVLAVVFAVLRTPHSSKGLGSMGDRAAAPTQGSTTKVYEVPEGSRRAVTMPPAGDRDGLAAPGFSTSQNFDAVRSPDDSDTSAAQVDVAIPHRPMIVRNAHLTVIASDFEAARSSLDDILRRHQGYIGEITTTVPEQGDRELTARLHIPSPQLNEALSEFKKLGRVEHETQEGEEVTSQFVDLEARLANARHTEQRLTELLRNRTGKIEDVLKVDEKISQTREYIERMEAERKSLLASVDFATLDITLRQPRKAQLQAAPPSVGARLHNAAVDGYMMLADGIIGFVEFLLSVGPSLLLWGAVIFFPARWAWRRRRRAASSH